MSPDRNDLIERDLQAHAKSLTELTLRLADTRQEAAIRVAKEELKDEYLEERLDRLEKRIDAIYRLGLWIVTTFGAVLIALVANFLFKGGLVIAP